MLEKSENSGKAGPRRMTGRRSEDADTGGRSSSKARDNAGMSRHLGAVPSIVLSPGNGLVITERP